MKKDIPIRKVTEIAIAIAPRQNYEDDHDMFWDVFILNQKPEEIENVLINSKGYGEREGEEIRTSQFRFYYEKIDGKVAIPVEQIKTDLLDLTAEYWVSFNYDGYMFDKKYIFVPGSLSKINFTEIPFIGKKGVMIR